MGMEVCSITKLQLFLLSSEIHHNCKCLLFPQPLCTTPVLFPTIPLATAQGSVHETFNQLHGRCLEVLPLHLVQLLLFYLTPRGGTCAKHLEDIHEQPKSVVNTFEATVDQWGRNHWIDAFLSYFPRRQFWSVFHKILQQIMQNVTPVTHSSEQLKKTHPCIGLPFFPISSSHSCSLKWLLNGLSAWKPLSQVLLSGEHRLRSKPFVRKPNVEERFNNISHIVLAWAAI